MVRTHLSFIFLGLFLQECLSRYPFNTDVCNIKECRKTAQRILDYMDPTVRPCDDFYRFACGHFLDNAQIRNDHAAIVGYHTKKVLYIGVKNKYCTPCTRAESTNQEAKPHTCYKNWSMKQSSTSMEAAIICEGFNKSEEMYGMRYARLIADDGDSSVYKKILESRPNKSITVKKIECRNHLLRNTCNKLKSLATTRTQRSTVYLRKNIGDNILRCRVAVQKATEHRKSEEQSLSEKIKNLRQDIVNIPSHVFGEHKCCADLGYFCDLDSTTAPSESNFVSRMTEAGLYQSVTDIFKDLSRHSRSLVVDVTSNYVEHYNSVIAKFIGGKRINFALRGSYQGRCSAAVVQYNSGVAHYSLHKEMYKASPGLYTKSTELKRKRKAERQNKKKKCKIALFSSSECDPDYGLHAQRPDIDETDLVTESEEFLRSLVKTDEEIKTIEREPVHQSDSSQWLEIRRNLLTASNFGQVCKMRSHTGCESLVYSAFDCEAMAYGRNNEDVARIEVGKQLGLQIESCGLFIDKEYPFLGASPDGLTNDNGIVEIKCPSSAKDLTPDEAIRKRKVTFWAVSKSGEIGEVKKSHKFFFQIQGQLHITNRNHCYFAIWTPKGTKITTIYKDDEFWNSMFEKLNLFYKTCILPELVDPRHCRSMPIRNPPHILEAQKKHSEKRKIKTKE